VRERFDRRLLGTGDYRAGSKRRASQHRVAHDFIAFFDRIEDCLGDEPCRSKPPLRLRGIVRVASN
jgi:hypothetical protein